MRFRTHGFLALVAILGLAALHLALYYPTLPEKMASHFGADGIANGWMQKSEFAFFYLFMMSLMTAVFGGISLLLRILPSDLINLPNRDYWLAPARREETIRAISDQMTWFGALTGALMIGMMHLTFIANQNATGRLSDTAWVLLVGYLAATVFWTVGLMRRFRKP